MNPSKYRSLHCNVHNTLLQFQLPRGGRSNTGTGTPAIASTGTATQLSGKYTPSRSLYALLLYSNVALMDTYFFLSCLQHTVFSEAANYPVIHFIL
jgi:hypothetical protein